MRKEEHMIDTMAMEDLMIDVALPWPSLMAAPSEMSCSSGIGSSD